MPSGRTFLRRLIDLSTTVKKMSHHISIDAESRKDISWWAKFLPTWNGKHKILEQATVLTTNIELYTELRISHILNPMEGTFSHIHIMPPLGKVIHRQEITFPL